MRISGNLQTLNEGGVAHLGVIWQHANHDAEQCYGPRWQMIATRMGCPKLHLALAAKARPGGLLPVTCCRRACTSSGLCDAQPGLHAWLDGWIRSDGLSFPACSHSRVDAEQQPGGCWSAPSSLGSRWSSFVRRWWVSLIPDHTTHDAQLAI
jgi:hypothetical protein